MAADNTSRGRPAPQELSGEALALLATVLWAGNFILARELRDDISPVALNFWRWTIATVVLALFAGRVSWTARGELWRHRWRVTLTGLLGITVYNVLVYQAGHSTQAVNLALIAVCTPVVIVLLARLGAGERVTGARTAGLAVAAVGVVVLVTGGSPRRLAALQFAPGDLLMLLATAVFAVYTLLIRRKPSTIDVAPFVFATFVVGDLLLLPAYVVDLMIAGPFTLDGHTAAALLYVGTAPSLIAFFAWNQAVAAIGASRPAVIYNLVPVFTGLGSWLLLGEPITVVQAAAAVLVVAGVTLGTRSPPTPDNGRRMPPDLPPHY